MQVNQVDDEVSTAANSLTGLAMMEFESGNATDTATLTSDAAVGGSVGGGSGERNKASATSGQGNHKHQVATNIPLAIAQPEPSSGGGSGGSGANNPKQPKRRKRALSMANSSGTIETSNSMTAAQDAQEATRQNNDDVANALLHQSSIGTNIMATGAENSIVSFGLNFNFDSTSSPSNSDSGEGAGNGGNGGEGSSEDGDDNNGNSNDTSNNTNTNKAPAKIIGIVDMKKGHKHHHKGKGQGSNEGKNSKGSSNKIGKSSSKTKKQAKVKFDPKLAPGGSGSSSSSGEEQNDSGGSASGGSNSGNGSSGGKSSISTLTTSSNQEWMDTNEAAADAADKDSGKVTKPSDKGKTNGVKHVVTVDGKPPANNKESGKKRKAPSKPATKGVSKDNLKGDKDGNDDDDEGYKTDEEQWGNSRNAEGNNQVTANGKGGLASLLRASSVTSSKKSNGSNEGPPTKQARFSIDHEHTHEHPTDAIRSVDASAMVLSSLSGSDSAGVPVTASSGGQTLGLSNSSGNPTAISCSNPSSSSGAKPANAKSAPNAKGKAATSNTDPNKRKERNAREKERSCRIAKQIDDLRTLLSRGGVIVSKGTKSSVLSEAANYINLLQQQQVQWEMDKQNMLQQMQQIGLNPNLNMGQPTNEGVLNGVMDAQAAVAQQQQQGIIPQQMPLGVQQGLPGQGGVLPVNPLEPQAAAPTNQNDYQFIFNNSSVGMAIASLGGAFVDCNSIFCDLSEYTKEETCSMTIFNMTSRQDLQHAFDLISQMITPTLGNAAGGVGIGEKGGEDKSSIVLRGAMKNRTDLGLSISLIKGENGIAKCFCVTLVRILSMETTKPDTVSIEMEIPQVLSTKQQKNVGFASAPAYTSG